MRFFEKVTPTLSQLDNSWTEKEKMAVASAIKDMNDRNDSLSVYEGCQQCSNCERCFLYQG